MEDVINKICGHLPEGLEIQLCMENGAAFVTLLDRGNGSHIKLPDSTDKTIVEQLNDAMCVANGFEAQPADSGGRLTRR